MRGWDWAVCRGWPSGGSSWGFARNEFVRGSPKKMGGMSGTELIAQLRAAETASALILLSGFAGCMGLTEENCGADAVLCKSNKEEEQLCRTVRLLLSRRTKKKPAVSEKRLRSSIARTV